MPGLGPPYKTHNDPTLASSRTTAAGGGRGRGMEDKEGRGPGEVRVGKGWIGRVQQGRNCPTPKSSGPERKTSYLSNWYLKSNEAYTWLFIVIRAT